MNQVVFDICRVILAAYFILGGLGHFSNAKGMSQYAAAKKLPLPMFSVIVSGLVLIAGGLSILLNYELLIGTILLAVFLFLAAVTIHNYWSESNPVNEQNQMAHFLKNIALAALVLMINQIQNWSW